MDNISILPRGTKDFRGILPKVATLQNRGTAGTYSQFRHISSAGETKPETKISNHNFLSISARNRLWGKVKQVVLGDINAEVTVEIVPGVEIVAVITKSSVQRFAVSPQKEVCVVIKSSDVMIAVEM
jgi:molybdopterin-binding protein